MGLDFNSIILVGSVLLFLSIVASKTVGRLSIPSIIFFILIGIAAGPRGLGLHFALNYSQNLGTVALTLILFSGGLDTKWESVKPIWGKGLALSTIGVLMTALSVGLFVHLITDFSLLEGILLGSIVSSTDAAAVFSILRGKNMGLKGKLRPILELESGSNDPMAYFLTIGLTGLIKNNSQDWLSLVPDFFIQMIIGTGSGIAMGFLMSKLINKIKLDFEGLYPALLLSMVFFTFTINHTIGGNGYLAVYLAGMILGNHNFIHKKTLLRFYDGQAWLVQIIMFILLGLLVYPDKVLAVTKESLLISGFLILIARPLGVFLSLSIGKNKCSFRDKLFLSSVGLRGAVPIILATYPLTAGLPGSGMIFNIVFFIVLTSVLIQGTAIGWIAKKLHLYVPEQIKRKFPLDQELETEISNELIEVVVPENSNSVGKSIMDLKLPRYSLIALIERGRKFVQPRGDTKIAAGDKLFIITKNEHEFEAITNKIT